MEHIDERFLPCKVEAVGDLFGAKFDCVVLVTNDLECLKNGPTAALSRGILDYASKDQSVSGGGSASLILGLPLPSKRLVLSHTGPINRDFDDVRRFQDAATLGIQRALSAGSRSPVLVIAHNSSFANAELVGILGALHALYVPLEIRDIKTQHRKVQVLGVSCENHDVVRIALALEAGRCVSRDVAGSDPERMAPPATAEYMQDVFSNSHTSVKVVTVDEVDKIRKEFPTMAAVNRGADVVQRHRARLIYLEYTGEGEIHDTLMLVGKGVTLDTGGLDVKTEGHMYGMSRDKSGSAIVGGWFKLSLLKILDGLRPKNIKVMGYMAMVRNSVGPESYSCDEIITARSGKRIRIVNTDAEGRMTMLDPLCHMKELALKEVNPHIFTVATLTGHAVLAIGNYTLAMDNGPALAKRFTSSLHERSIEMGDIVEISRLRREDYEFHKGKTEYEDLVQSNQAPSSRTERGHMTPAAFLIMGSGLDEHGIDSTTPIPYTHIDMAGVDGPFPGVPQGRPLLALANRFILP